jgi:hypothetical protein
VLLAVGGNAEGNDETVIPIRQAELPHDVAPWNIGEVRRVSAEWTNSIQLTPLRSSLKAGDELLAEISARLLVEPLAVGAYHHRPRSLARQMKALAVKRALRARLGVRATGLVKTLFPLQGALSAHHFDVVAANGKPLFAAEAISLDQAEQRHVERDINSAGSALRDVKATDADFPTAIVTLLPPGAILDADQQANIARVKAITRSVGVDHVPERDLPEWSRGMAARVPLG